MDNNEIKHAGIKGMRWGIRRWQNKDGSLTPAGKKRYGDYDPGENKKKGKEETPEERELAKQRALKSGSAKEILKYQGELSNKEMQDAINRLNLEQQLTNLNKSKKVSVVDTVDKAVNAAEVGIKAYNAIAKINNSFNTRQLPSIGSGDTAANRHRKIFDRHTEALVKSGTVDQIIRNFGRFSSKELAQIEQRWQAEARITARRTPPTTP